MNEETKKMGDAYRDALLIQAAKYYNGIKGLGIIFTFFSVLALCFSLMCFFEGPIAVGFALLGAAVSLLILGLPFFFYGSAKRCEAFAKLSSGEISRTLYTEFPDLSSKIEPTITLGKYQNYDGEDKDWQAAEKEFRRMEKIEQKQLEKEQEKQIKEQSKSDSQKNI